MGKYTEMMSGGKYSQMLSQQRPVERKPYDLAKTFPGEGAKKQDIKQRVWTGGAPEQIMSPTQVRDISSKTERGVADLSGSSDEHYASIANAQYFKSQFAIDSDDAVAQEKIIGRALYGNGDLSSYQINSLIKQDINQGTFDRRVQMSKWTQHGVDEGVAKQIDDIYHSTFSNSFEQYAGAAPSGVAKAFAGLVSGMGDTLDSAFGTDFWKTPMADTTARNIEAAQKYYLDDALIRGNYADYIGGMTAKTGGDVFGNMYLMGKSIKAANAWTGGRMTLAAKGKTWKTLAKSTAARSTFLAGLNYVKTQGTPKQKFQSAMLTFAYMNTPVISSLSKTNSGAFLNDFILNSGISASWNPEDGEFQFGGQYAEAWEDAKEMESETGADARMIMVGNIIPILGSDIAFSALTKSIKAQSDLPAMKSFSETARIIKSKSAVSVTDMSKALESKYGDGWEKSMSDVDRVRYNATKTIESAVSGGVIDPSLMKPATMPDKARVEISDGKAYYRLPDGELVPVSRVDPEITPKAIEAEVPREVGDLVKLAEEIERAMSEGRYGEFIKTDWEGRGGIDEPARVDTKGTNDLTPPDAGIRRIEDWTGKQITYISKLIQMGEIKTNKDYEAILDSYTQRGDVDPKVIYDQAKKAAKHVADVVKSAEGKSKKAKVTQSGFKREKQMVVIDSMEIIKDRIKSLSTGVKEGKKLGIKKEKDRAQAVKDIAVEGVRIVEALAPDRATKNRFKVQAQRLKTEAALAKFVDNVTTFLVDKADADERSKLVKSITKDSPVMFDAEYRSAIGGIQKSITSKGVSTELEGAIAYLKQNPDAKMPKRISDQLDKTDVKDLSTADLRVVAEEVDRIRQVGTTKAKLLRAGREKALIAEAKKMSDNFKAPKQSAIKRAEKEAVTGAKKKKITLKYIDERSAQFFDRLDGGKAKFDGPAHERFINQVNRDAAQEAAMTDARTSGFIKLKNELGMKVGDLNKRVEIGGEKFTLQQIAGIYAISKNRLGYNALLHGNLKDKDGKAIIDRANQIVNDSPQLRILADYVLHDFASNSERIFKTIGKVEGVMPKLEDFYIPLEREGDASKVGADDVMTQVMARQDIIDQTPSDKFIFERKEIPTKYQTPVNINLFDLWNRSVATQEHYIANAQNVKDMRSITNRVKADVKLSYGSAGVKYVEEYIDVVANPMSIYGRKDFEVLSRRLRKNVATAYLAGNMKTMIKQSPSLALYLGETTPKYLHGSIAEMVGAFQKDGSNALVDFVMEKDPLIKSSKIQREMSELRDVDQSKYDKVMSKVGDIGFKGIIEVDRLVRSVGWYATYKHAKESLGLGEDAAIERARNATLRTQPTASPKDLPPIYRTNEGLNWMLMFSNQLNQIWNMQTKEIPKLIKSGQVGKALSKQGGMALSAMMIWAINNGKPLPESEDEISEAFSDQFMATIPLVGSQVMSGAKGYSTSNPVTEVFSKAGKMYVKLASGEEIKSSEYYDLFFSGIGSAAGAPTVAIERTKKALKDGDLSELTGVKKRK